MNKIREASTATYKALATSSHIYKDEVGRSASLPHIYVSIHSHDETDAFP